MEAPSPAWASLLKEPTDDYHEGYVTSVDELNHLIDLYCLHCNADFVKVNSSVFRTDDDYRKAKHCIKWDCKSDKGPVVAFFGHPFIVTSHGRLECHHGPQRSKKKIKLDDTKDVVHQTRVASQPSKKIDCPAKIVLKTIVIFWDDKYQVSQQTRGKLCYMAKYLKYAISQREEGRTETRLYVKLPHDTDHSNHSLDESVGNLKPDKRLVERAHQLITQEGVGSVDELQSHIELYVKHTLFDGQQPPPRTNRRFHPTRKDLYNIMYKYKADLTTSGQVKKCVENGGGCKHVQMGLLLAKQRGTDIHSEREKLASALLANNMFEVEGTNIIIKYEDSVCVYDTETGKCDCLVSAAGEQCVGGILVSNLNIVHVNNAQDCEVEAVESVRTSVPQLLEDLHAWASSDSYSEVPGLEQILLSAHSMVFSQEADNCQTIVSDQCQFKEEQVDNGHKQTVPIESVMCTEISSPTKKMCL